MRIEGMEELNEFESWCSGLFDASRPLPAALSVPELPGPLLVVTPEGLFSKREPAKRPHLRVFVALVDEPPAWFVCDPFDVRWRPADACHSEIQKVPIHGEMSPLKLWVGDVSTIPGFEVGGRKSERPVATQDGAAVLKRLVSDESLVASDSGYTGFIVVRLGRELEDAFIVGSVLRAALQAGQPPLVDGVFSWWLRPVRAAAEVGALGQVREVFEIVELE